MAVKVGEGPAMQAYKKGKAVDRARNAATRAKKAAEGARRAAGPAKQKTILDKIRDRKRRLADA